MEKKTIKRLCPFKMLGREEEWLNDMLQKGWLLKKKGDFIFANPGSISLPKGMSTHSYILLDENKIILKDIDGKIINEYKY